MRSFQCLANWKKHMTHIHKARADCDYDRYCLQTGIVDETDLGEFGDSL